MQQLSSTNRQKFNKFEGDKDIMSISSKINDIIQDKASVDKASPFLNLFGVNGIILAVIGTVFSLNYGLDIIDHDTWTGLCILVGGILASWTLGMMILGFAMMIDSTLKTTTYTRKMLELMLTEKGYEVHIDSKEPTAEQEYETLNQKCEPIVDDESKSWTCPICSREHSMETRRCECGYTVPDQFTFSK